MTEPRPLAELAELIRDAFAKRHDGMIQWLDNTKRLAKYLAEARAQ